MLSERSWLLPCDNVKKLNKVYKNYKTTYQELIISTFERWNCRLKASYENKLDKKILVGNQNDQYWHLTVNLDRYLENINEKSNTLISHLYILVIYLI